MNSLPKLTGVILAGGAGRRMGGADKGLVEFHGQALVKWVIDALAPQVDEILIVANRNLETYRAFGHTVVSDIRPDFPGPLAGFEAALMHARHDWILTCPTDAPYIPHDYASRLLQANQGGPAVVQVGGHLQPVFALLPRSILPRLSASMDAGERAAYRWIGSLAPAVVSMDDCAEALRDADSLETLRELESGTPNTADNK